MSPTGLHYIKLFVNAALYKCTNLAVAKVAAAFSWAGFIERKMV